jgi:hypothetical protein
MSNSTRTLRERCRSTLKYVRSLQAILEAREPGTRAFPHDWDDVAISETLLRKGMWIGEHESRLSTMGFLMSFADSVDMLNASMNRLQATKTWLNTAADLLECEIDLNSKR